MVALLLSVTIVIDSMIVGAQRAHRRDGDPSDGWIGACFGGIVGLTVALGIAMVYFIGSGYSASLD